MLLWDRRGNCELTLILSYLDVAVNLIQNVIAQAIEFLSACYMYLLLLVWHAPHAVISLHGRFWAKVIASSRERLLDVRSCWIVFIHVVRGRPDGLLQFSEEEAVVIFLASVSSVVSAMWSNWERRRAKVSSAFVGGTGRHIQKYVRLPKLNPLSSYYYKDNFDGWVTSYVCHPTVFHVVYSMANCNSDKDQLADHIG